MNSANSQHFQELHQYLFIHTHDNKFVHTSFESWLLWTNREFSACLYLNTHLVIVGNGLAGNGRGTIEAQFWRGSRVRNSLRINNQMIVALLSEKLSLLTLSWQKWFQHCDQKQEKEGAGGCFENEKGNWGEEKREPKGLWNQGNASLLNNLIDTG